MTVTNLAELAAHIDGEVREAMRLPTLDAVRAIANEAGIRRARIALAEAPDRLAAAQAAYRDAQAVEAAARESYQQALMEAEWEVDGDIHKDGNKTYRWLACECDGNVKDCPVCAGAGKTRRFMLADEVKTWRSAEAAKNSHVIVFAARLHTAEENTAAARDALGVADKRLSAAKYEVQAAIAELNALAVGLAAKGA